MRFRSAVLLELADFAEMKYACVGESSRPNQARRQRHIAGLSVFVHLGWFRTKDAQLAIVPLEDACTDAGRATVTGRRYARCPAAPGPDSWADHERDQISFGRSLAGCVALAEQPPTTGHLSQGEHGVRLGGSPRSNKWPSSSWCCKVELASVIGCGISFCRQLIGVLSVW
jgi:hypothetical protein